MSLNFIQNQGGGLINFMTILNMSDFLASSVFALSAWSCQASHIFTIHVLLGQTLLLLQFNDNKLQRQKLAISSTPRSAKLSIGDGDISIFMCPRQRYAGSRQASSNPTRSRLAEIT